MNIILNIMLYIMYCIYYNMYIICNSISEGDEHSMNYNSKKNIVSMAAGIIWIAAYILYINSGNSPAPEDIRAWVKLMLVFIGIGVVAQIVIIILFHIAFAIGVAAVEHAQGRTPDENVERIIKSSMLEDERDKLIEYKSGRIGQIISGVGIITALVVLAGGAPVFVALHICFGVCAAGMMAEGVVAISLHERGLRNER